MKSSSFTRGGAGIAVDDAGLGCDVAGGGAIAVDDSG
jgi:hypothetical protein